MLCVCVYEVYYVSAPVSCEPQYGPRYGPQYGSRYGPWYGPQYNGLSQVIVRPASIYDQVRQFGRTSLSFTKGEDNDSL